MKSIMFKTKIFHEVKMYLLVSDVTKMMEISEKAFFARNILIRLLRSLVVGNVSQKLILIY